MQLPRNQELNGTAEMIVEMRSTLEPDIVFTNRTEYDFLAEVACLKHRGRGMDQFVLDVQSFGMLGDSPDLLGCHPH